MPLRIEHSVLLLAIAACDVSAGVRPHPRLEVNAAVLEQIRTLRDAKDPYWTRFQKWTSQDRRTASPHAYILSNMLMFLVGDDAKNFERAWEFVQGKIYRNHTGREGGLMPLLDFYGGDAHKAAFQGGTFIGTIAHFYDWGYARLSVDERKDLADWLMAACSYTFQDNRSSRAFLRNDGAAAVYGLGAAAYALLGDIPEAEKLLGWFHGNWGEVVKGLDIMGKGGALGEGNAYGTSPTAANFIAAADVAYYAAGEDLFVSHPWFRKRLLYDAFAAYPGTIGGPSAPVHLPASPIVEQASIGGDGRRALSWHSLNLRTNGLILSRRFAGTEEANTWNWVFRQPEVDRMVDDGQAYMDLLYYSKRPALVKPTRLSYYDPSMGYVYIRSDWDSADATWIAFWAGPHIDTHQHLDQGAFAIFKRRDLAPKTGHYDNDNVKSAHHLAYYTRTVSSNGILVGDPKEVFRAFIAGMGCDQNGKGDRIPAPDRSEPVCIPNDGGQRTMSPKGLAVGNAANFYENREIWDVARVVSFRDDGESVAVVADITNAYNNSRYTTPGNAAKVTRVYRRLVYLRPLDLLLIADTVEAANANFEKKWLLHALDRVEIGGDVERIRPGETVHTNIDQAKVIVDDKDPSDKRQTTFDLRRGYAALLLKTLLPSGFRYRVVGGRDPADTPDADLYGYGKNSGHLHRHVNDFWVKDFSEGVLPGHKSFNWAPAFAIEAFAEEYVPVYGPGYGRWRLELEPSQQSKTDYFLNILKPALNPSETLPRIERIETDTEFGAIVHTATRTFRVLFHKDSLDAPQIGQ
jgi:hypothetical protein